jgi:hypothetical protein
MLAKDELKKILLTDFIGCSLIFWFIIHVHDIVALSFNIYASRPASTVGSMLLAAVGLAPLNKMISAASTNRWSECL